MSCQVPPGSDFGVSHRGNLVDKRGINSSLSLLSPRQQFQGQGVQEPPKPPGPLCIFTQPSHTELIRSRRELH